jgi:hypothetical protein
MLKTEPDLKKMRLVSSAEMFSAVLLSNLLPGRGHFLQNAAVNLRLSFFG